MSIRWRGKILAILGLLLVAYPAANAQVTVPSAPADRSASIVRMVYPAASPALWLSPDGKSDAWAADTQKCRELLAKLDVNDARAKRYLSRIKQKAEILGWVNGFDWRTRTAVEFLQSMLEDIAAGKEPLLRYAGKGFGYAYWSNTLRRIEATWVHVPPSYDPAKSYQLFIYYKCGGGIQLKDGKAAGGYRPDEQVANETDTFHAWSSLDIQIKGRYGGGIELEEFPAALSRDFSVDPDRVFLSGWSDGGFTALMLAAHYPHLVAGIAPLCANWQYTNIENVALRNIPILMVDGWGDGGYNSGQFLRWQCLRGWGSDVSCVWGHHGHSYQPYEDIEEFKYILDWAKTKKRNLWPKQVHYATWNLAWNRAYWVYVDRLADPMLAGQIDVQVKEQNRIEVMTWNVAAYHLNLSEKLVDPRKNVTIVTEGKESYAGALKERIDVELVKKPEGMFVKSADMADEISAVMDAGEYRRSGSGREAQVVPGRTWLAVRGTTADEATSKSLEKWIPRSAKADSEVTDADIAEQNLFLYGGPDINKLTARIAPELPVKFEKGKFTLGSTVYDQPTHCIAFIHPNPLNPKKYVIVYAFNDAATFTKNGCFSLTSQREFRTGDAMVKGIAFSLPKFGMRVDGAAYPTRYVMFGPDWKPDQRPALGEAEKPFDYLQLLRLRADALREAAGVDVGIVWEHVPPWNRWNSSLAAVQVTMADLATQDQLPEYVCIGEMRGSELLARRGSAAAMSVLPEIDPSKTYRVAFAFNGVPSYGAEPPKMPKLFKWATPEEFLAGPGTRIPVRNLVQTPLQTAEAVAQYVRKHKKISPRPVADSLTEYIANPRDNDYGSSDWLHLGMDIPSKQVGRGSNDRYTLNLGVRAAGGGEAGSPGKNAKHFAELPLSAGAAPMDFDFAALDRKLPLTINSKITGSAVTVDNQGKTYALAAVGAPGAIGEAALVEIQLTNKGSTDLAITAVLSDTVMRSIYGQVWPEDVKGKAWYAGYHRAIGPNQQPPRHEDAALLLLEGKPRTLVAPSAGYNFGLVGVAQDVTVKARQSLALALLLISIDRPEGGPDIRLSTALEGTKEQLLGRTYTTTFDGLEDPLSEGGRWNNNGLDWTHIKKKDGFACGTQTGTNKGAAKFDDSYAHLSGFPPDHEAWGVAHIAKPNPSCHQELEILLRFTSSPHRTTGYECLARCTGDDSSYLEIVRWDGPLGKFTYLARMHGPDCALKNGDTLKASIVGNVITVYINGVKKAQAKDDTFKTGNPGIGLYLQCDGGKGIGSNSDFGFSSFTARGIGPATTSR